MIAYAAVCAGFWVGVSVLTLLGCRALDAITIAVERAAARRRALDDARPFTARIPAQPGPR